MVTPRIYAPWRPAEGVIGERVAKGHFRLPFVSPVGAVAFLFCVFTTFSFTLPVGANLRSTDVIALIAGVWLVAELISGRRLNRAAAPLAVAGALALMGVGLEAFLSGQRDGAFYIQSIMGRILIATLPAYRLGTLMLTEKLRKPTLLGLAAGLLISLGTVWIDSATFNPAQPPPGVDPAQIVYINGIYRAKGVFVHPNAAAACIGLIVPLLIGLVVERRLNWLWLAASTGVLLFTFILTQSRGPIISALVVLSVWTIKAVWRSSRKGLAIFAFCGAVATAAVVAAIYVDASVWSDLAQRVTDLENVQSNLSDRIETITQSLLLALQSPFGLGSDYPSLLSDATGFAATHNAYTELALLLGVPFALFVSWRLIRLALKAPFSMDAAAEPWIALYLILSFCFEDLYGVSFIPIIVLWLISRPSMRSEVPEYART